MRHFLYNSTGFAFCLLLINIALFLSVYRLYLEPYEHVDLSYQTYLLSDSHGLPLGNNNHVGPPDSTKHERTPTADRERVQINTHGLTPTTNNENFNGAVADNSIQIKNKKNGFFNFASGSDSYVDMLRKLRYLIAKTNVEKIIITADEHQLSPYREFSNNQDRSVHFTTLEDFPSLFASLKIHFKRYMPILNPKSRDIVKTYIESRFEEKRVPLPWYKVPVKEKDRRSQRRYWSQFRFKKRSEHLADHLRKIIALCKKHGIELVGIQYPLSDSYLKQIAGKSFGTATLFREHHLKIYDFTDRYRDNDKLFLNTDHLNDIGGTMLSTLLASKP